VTINRRDLIAIPVPDANLLWRDLHVRDVHRRNDRQETRNIRVEVVVDGLTEGKPWSCGSSLITPTRSPLLPSPAAE
jgi:hypothetical protein